MIDRKITLGDRTVPNFVIAFSRSVISTTRLLKQFFQ